MPFLKKKIRSIKILPNYKSKQQCSINLENVLVSNFQIGFNNFDCCLKLNSVGQVYFFILERNSQRGYHDPRESISSCNTLSRSHSGDISPLGLICLLLFFCCVLFLCHSLFLNILTTANCTESLQIRQYINLINDYYYYCYCYITHGWRVLKELAF